MRHSVWFLPVFLIGCGQLGLNNDTAPQASAAQGVESGTEAGNASVEAPPPPPAARTVEQFDTTTESQRAEAAAVPETSAEEALGTSVASLGDPAQPGFWMETPLVSEERSGRVVYEGNSAAVTLRPISGPATAGSRLSLAAMRVLGAPLTALPEVEVYAQ